MAQTHRGFGTSAPPEGPKARRNALEELDEGVAGGKSPLVRPAPHRATQEALPGGWPSAMELVGAWRNRRPGSERGKRREPDCRVEARIARLLSLNSWLSQESNPSRFSSSSPGVCGLSRCHSFRAFRGRMSCRDRSHRRRIAEHERLLHTRKAYFGDAAFAVGSRRVDYGVASVLRAAIHPLSPGCGNDALVLHQRHLCVGTV